MKKDKLSNGHAALDDEKGARGHDGDLKKLSCCNGKNPKNTDAQIDSFITFIISFLY
jgi:hypothetical protein